MVGYFDSLRAEVAPSGVKVMTVIPGYIATDHSASAVGSDGMSDDNAKRGCSRRSWRSESPMASRSSCLSSWPRSPTDESRCGFVPLVRFFESGGKARKA